MFKNKYYTEENKTVRTDLTNLTMTYIKNFLKSSESNGDNQKNS